MALRSGWFSGDNFHLNRVSQVELPEDLCTEEERQTVGDANENTDPTRQQQGKNAKCEFKPVDVFVRVLF